MKMHLVDCLYCSLNFILKLTLDTCQTCKPAQIFPINAAFEIIKTCRNNLTVVCFKNRSLFSSSRPLGMIYSKITLIYTIL